MARALARRHATKTEHRERLIVVIGLNDTANIKERLLILIGRVSNEMKRVLAPRVTIAAGVVDTGDKADLPTGAQVVNEGGRHKDFEFPEIESCSITAI